MSDIQWRNGAGGMECTIGRFTCRVAEYAHSRVSAWVLMKATDGCGEGVCCSHNEDLRTIIAGRRWCVEEIRRVCVDALLDANLLSVEQGT